MVVGVADPGIDNKGIRAAATRSKTNSNQFFWHTARKTTTRSTVTEARRSLAFEYRIELRILEQSQSKAFQGKEGLNTKIWAMEIESLCMHQAARLQYLAESLGN